MDRSVSVPVYLAGEIEEPGTEAIEVVAMRGEQVETVAHLTNPLSGQITTTTRVMLASGAAASATALAIFFATVYGSSNVSAARDFFAFALLAYGVVGIIRGLRRRADELAPRDFVIGTTAKATCTIGAGVLPMAEVPLVRGRAGGWDVLTCPGMSGAIERGTQTETLAAGQMIPLQSGMKVMVDAGAHRFFIRATTRPKSHAQPLLGGVRWDEQTYLAGSALAHVLVLIGLLSVPRDARALSQDDMPWILSRTSVFVAPPVAKEDPLKNLAKLPGDAAVEGQKGKRMAGPESLAGNPKSKDHGKTFAIKGPADNRDPGMPKRLVNDMINSTGAVSVLGRYSASSVGSIYGREGALGNNAIDALGELKPGTPGDSWGQGGWGNHPGIGRGGGGDGYGTVGLDKIGTIGIYGNGDKTYGGHVGGSMKRHATVPDPVVGVPDIKGRLDKELIRRIVRRHLNEVKFCYEQEAIRHPDIGGRLIVQFTIGGNGIVSNSAVAKSMGNGVVDQCVSQAVRRWEFPSPEGGGIVIVSYPFLLTMSGT